MPTKFFPQVRLQSSAWSILGDQVETPPTAGGRSLGQCGPPRLGTPVPSSLRRPAAHHPAAQPPRLPAALPAPTGSPPGIERGPPPPAPPGPADLRDGRREGLLARGADQPRLEKCQSQGQQAASSHLRDRRSVPSLPARRRRSCTRRGTEPGRRRLPEGAWREAGRAGHGRAGRAGPGGLSSAWLPLRATAASPAPPSRATVETELGQPAGARALWLPALASLIYPRSPRRGRGRGGGGGGGAGTRRLRGWGWPERGSGCLPRAGLGEAAVGGQREGRASEPGGDGPGAALHTRQRGTPKVAVACSRRGACGGRADPARRCSPRDHRPPASIHRSRRLQPSTLLASSGLFFAQSGWGPQTLLPGVESAACLRIMK